MPRFLVIDDCPDITELLETILSNDTHRVQTAHCGRDGLRLLGEHTFDLVITDLIMPELDGFDVIMKINEMQPRPRVIAMTGGSERLSREYLTNLAEALRVQHVLQKPFSVDELMASVFLHDSCDVAGARRETATSKSARGRVL